MDALRKFLNEGGVITIKNFDVPHFGGPNVMASYGGRKSNRIPFETSGQCIKYLTEDINALIESIDK